MEKLKSAIHGTIKRKIAESTAEDLPSTCSSLYDFLHSLPLFHHLIEDLRNPEMGLCRKNKEAALELKRKGNKCFSAGEYSDALSFYSQALRVAPSDADDKGNNLVAVLYLNRGSTFHKMSLLMQCVRDCKRALAINPRYAKAWYRRGNANTLLKNYEDAMQDLKLASIMEQSNNGKRQIERDLMVILGQLKVQSRFMNKHNDNKACVFDEKPQVKLQCVSTAIKARGMSSSSDIPEASLIHNEEAYAAIILKNYRETHCHFCFNELPADTVPCLFCTIPLYCSEHCRIQAGGRQSTKFLMNDRAVDVISGALLDYFSAVTSESLSTSSINFPEHQHECQGANWPSVLPSDVVLAGRFLVKSMWLTKYSSEEADTIKNLDLCHHYAQMPPAVKLEIHIFSLVLLNCLQLSNNSTSQFTGENISKVVIIISQIKVNSMTIVRVKSLDVRQPLNQLETMSTVEGALVSIIEQVRVAEAIYPAGSFFNHSCQPNIHAYFISRTLLIRATEYVARGTPLELSYGPQVGQWDCGHRQQFLKDKYSFKCLCHGCSEVNLSDLVLNAFRCVKPSCAGVVLDCSLLEYEKSKCNYLPGTQENSDDVNIVTSWMLKKDDCQPGYCLSCGSSCNIQSLSTTVDKAEIYIRSLKEEIGAGRVHAGGISTALISLEILQSTLHAYNKKIAEAEDIVAQAFCLSGDLRPALDHCIASIKIIQRLYNPGHIVIGNELVKLASLQLALGDSSASNTISQLTRIYSRYYGNHVYVMFPHLKSLEMEVRKFS